MKNLLIHAGYPKAASTTLQNKLFLGLHREGTINFLGRAFETGYSGAGSRTDYKIWLKSVMEDRADLSDAAFHKIFPPISADKLNVYSEGMYINAERHGDDYAMARKIHSYFSGRVDDIKVFFMLRNPASLMLSYYIQKYRVMDKGNFSEFLEHNISSEWRGEGKIFRLYDLVSSYAQVFGKENIKFAVFEDLSNDRDRFCRDVSEALGVPANDIDTKIGSGRLNATRKGEGGFLVRKFPKYSLRGLLNKWFPNSAITRSLDVRIPDLTDAQRQKIFDIFKDSNRALAREYGLDESRLSGYRYF